MAQIPLSESSYKTVRQSSNFLHSIWRPTQKFDIEANVYHDYYKTEKCNYVNDFLDNCWKKTSEISPEQVVCIHEDNKLKACKHKNSQINGSTFTKEKSYSSGIIVTDEFLDDLQISKGQREERIEIFKKQSDVFFYFLSLHIGTERIVRLRRHFFNEYFIFPKLRGNISMEIIGSKSEGLDMAASDFDLLWVYNWTVRDKGDTSNNERIDYEYDSLMDGIHPGYVMLDTSSHLVRNFQVESEKKRAYFEREKHGPACMFSVHGKDYDFITAVKSASWPRIATEWINRKREYGWPSQEMVQSIVQNGCHIVPVGSTRNLDYDKDWRLSFCKAEKELIKTFSHTQMLVYGVLKLVLKELIETKISGVMCSYFFKTVMFWVVEETSSSYWSSENILPCFHLCVRRLIQFVVDENCPNYFVITNNMFRERFNASNKDTLLQVLCDIGSSGWQWVMKTKSLKRFPYYITCGNLKVLRNTTQKKEQLDIFDLLCQIVNVCRQTISGMIARRIPVDNSFLSKVCQVPIIRQYTISELCHFLDTDNRNRGNKNNYALHKLKIQLLTMDSRNNLISGKALLASWLYNQEKYQDCLQVTDLGLRNVDLCIFQNGERIMQADLFEHVLSCTHDFTDIQYLSLSYIAFPEKSSLLIRELLEKSEFSTESSLPHHNVLCPISYTFFLRCLCYFRLREENELEFEYAKMKYVPHAYCGKLKSIHQIEIFQLKIIFNTLRYNISFDFQTPFELALIVGKYYKEFDTTAEDVFEFLLNESEQLHERGVTSSVISDYFFNMTHSYMMKDVTKT